MGWNVTEAKFQYAGNPTKAMGHGNNVAWACAKCTHPILFEYRQAGFGSIPTNPVVCPGCGMRYYLEPKWITPDFRESRPRAAGSLEEGGCSLARGRQPARRRRGEWGTEMLRYRPSLGPCTNAEYCQGVR